MIERIREARKNESGFTLIELLIVIIVLGVLAAIVLFALGTFKSDSALAACKTDRKQLETAEIAYANSHSGSYVAGTNTDTSLQALVTANYLKSIPKSDNYTLTVTSTGVTTGAMVSPNTGTCA
jgi:prepilin-type N-terminal cleavage/methylation domain-containing protein